MTVPLSPEHRRGGDLNVCQVPELVYTQRPLPLAAGGHGAGARHEAEGRGGQGRGRRGGGHEEQSLLSKIKHRNPNLICIHPYYVLLPIS